MLNPYPETLPDSVSKAWNNRMKQFFDLFEKHADVISRVTAWGVSDSDSWKNDFPVKGRHDYPLLFDRNYQPKPFVKEIMAESQSPAEEKEIIISFIYKNLKFDITMKKRSKIFSSR